jgi:hypothetical protein
VARFSTCRRSRVVPDRPQSKLRCGGEGGRRLARAVLEAGTRRALHRMHSHSRRLGQFEDSCLLLARRRSLLDSPLEGTGFELSVPRQMGCRFETVPLSPLCRSHSRRGVTLSRPGTESSHPSPSSGESTNLRFLFRLILGKPVAFYIEVEFRCERTGQFSPALSESRLDWVGALTAAWS